MQLLAWNIMVLQLAEFCPNLQIREEHGEQDTQRNPEGVVTCESNGKGVGTGTESKAGISFSKSLLHLIAIGTQEAKRGHTKLGARAVRYYGRVHGPHSIIDSDGE